jgi:hypothetical protein
MTKSALAVEVDGRALPADEARTLWEEFSRHLDEHELDFDGFAKSKGFASVRPTHKGGRAVLLVETTAKTSAPRPKQTAPASARGAGKSKKKAR